MVTLPRVFITVLITVLIVTYVVPNYIRYIGHIHYTNPMIHTFYEIKYAEKGKRFTVHEVRQLIKGKLDGYKGWPYTVSMEGDGTNWILRFNAKPKTWWQQAWWIIRYWRSAPDGPIYYEIRRDSSGSLVMRYEWPDGSTGTTFGD